MKATAQFASSVEQKIYSVAKLQPLLSSGDGRANLSGATAGIGHHQWNKYRRETERERAKRYQPLIISDFWNHLEATRSNRARTRNLRLAAIRSFFRFATLEAPDHGGVIQRVLAIFNKH